MTVTAKCINKYLSGDTVYVTFEYTDGKSIIQRNYKSNQPTETWLQDTVAAECSRLDKVLSFNPTVEDSAITPQPGPSEEEQAYVAALNKLEMVKPLLEIGAMTIEDEALVPVIKTIVDYVRTKLGA